MSQHKHHDLIVAWAKGAKIQYKNKDWDDDEPWKDTNHTPQWSLECFYRIKPEPMPDVVVLVHVNPCGYVWNQGTGVWQHEIKNLRITIDGETRKLKKAEVIDEA